MVSWDWSKAYQRFRLGASSTDSRPGASGKRLPLLPFLRLRFQFSPGPRFHKEYRLASAFFYITRGDLHMYLCLFSRPAEGTGCQKEGSDDADGALSR